MPNSQAPLRFKISSWKQLPECRSNNDRNFRIRLTEIHQPPCLDGLRISVEHPNYGVVFAEVLHAHGTAITGLSNSNAMPLPAFELDTEHILQELRKFGFYITYDQRSNLPLGMLEYLNTLRGLGFDKLRILNTYETLPTGVDDFKWYVVGFKSCQHKSWLNNTYVASKKEFTDALLHGTCMNISSMSSAKNFNWSWLDYVANIEDILKDNMEELARGN